MISKGLVFPLGLLGGLAIGCSDPVPPPAQGDSIIHYGPAGSDPSACTIGAHIATIPAGNQKTGVPDHTKNDPGTRAVDGQNGAGVTCRAAGSSSFSFNGNISAGAASFVVKGTVTKGGGGSGRVAAADPGTAGHGFAPGSGDPSCTFSVAEQNLQVAPGRVWATFICPTVRDDQNASIICGTNGEFVLENCEQ